MWHSDTVHVTQWHTPCDTLTHSMWHSPCDTMKPYSSQCYGLLCERVGHWSPCDRLSTVWHVPCDTLCTVWHSPCDRCKILRQSVWLHVFYQRVKQPMWEIAHSVTDWQPMWQTENVNVTNSPLCDGLTKPMWHTATVKVTKCPLGDRLNMTMWQTKTVTVTNWHSPCDIQRPSRWQTAHSVTVHVTSCHLCDFQRPCDNYLSDKLSTLPQGDVCNYLVIIWGSCQE